MLQKSTLETKGNHEIKLVQLLRYTTQTNKAKERKNTTLFSILFFLMDISSLLDNSSRF